MAYQFKIKLLNVKKPPVWRRVIVPENYTFEDLHYVIQICFGWQDEHLHKFGNKPYGGDFEISSRHLDDEEDFNFFLSRKFMTKRLDECTTKLNNVFGDGRKKLMYTYDFGDDWIHEIILEDIPDEVHLMPKCLAAKGSCPPENCGGPMGYEMLKGMLTNKPNSTAARNAKRELGLAKDEEIDLNFTDVDAINAELKNLALYMRLENAGNGGDVTSNMAGDIEWAERLHCAVTVCDTDGTILYMNEKSRSTFAKHGDLIGCNMFDCHSPASQEKIRKLLATDGTNSYTIEKNGQRKMIYQTTWKRDGKVAGLVEISMVIPEEMPHYVRG